MNEFDLPKKKVEGLSGGTWSLELWSRGEGSWIWRMEGGGGLLEWNEKGAFLRWWLKLDM